jgi:GNAT superfamily N-acetyltransferase
VAPSISWNTLDPAQTAYDGDHTLTAIGYDGCASGTSSDKIVAVVNRNDPYKATFSVNGEVPLEATAGAAGENQVGFYVVIQNDSSSGIPPWSASSIFVRYRWMRPDGSSVADGPNVSLGGDVPPTGQDLVAPKVIVDPPPLDVGVDRSQLTRARLIATWEAYQSMDIMNFAAFVDGRVVAAGGIQFTPYGAYLAGGSTHPDYRGRGCYRALVRARWNAAVTRGTPLLAVQAGAMSKPILERLGFRQIATVHALVDRP